MKSGPNSDRVRRTVLWAISLPALLAASFFYLPYAFTGPVLCPMRLVLGLPCPGCGLTRAFCLMSHGRFAEALAFHGLAPLMLGYLAFLWIYKVVESARGTPLRLPNEKIGLTACLVLAGFWIVRLVAFFADGGLDVMGHDNIVSRVFRFFS